MLAPKDEAARRFERAAERIRRARAQPAGGSGLHEWLDALVEYVDAFAELHRDEGEAMQAKLHLLAVRLHSVHVLTGTKLPTCPLHDQRHTS